MYGSSYWIPPEMIRGEQHSYPCDIWSFSVCILELFICKPPYYPNAITCMFKTATGGFNDVFSQFVVKLTPEIRSFFDLCLVTDQQKRSTAEELLTHSWVTQPKLLDTFIEVIGKVFISNVLVNECPF